MIGTLAASLNVDPLTQTPMTTADNLLEELKTLARSAAAAEGVDVAWCELKGSEGSRIFRVFIERVDGDVGLADCERVTKRLSLVLDVEDPIESAYTLEVSTPGLDRPLHDAADYERFTGKLARVKTREAVDGRKRFDGRLAGVSDGFLTITEQDGEGEEIRIPLSVIDSGRLEIDIDLPNRARSRKRA